MSLTNIAKNSKCETETRGACESAADSAKPRYECPRYRIFETNSGYVGEIDVPGVSSSGVELSVDNGVLEVSARRDVELNTEWKAYAGYREDSLVYRLRLALEDEIAVEGIQAKVEDGVLRVDFPKEEGKRARRITVN